MLTSEFNLEFLIISPLLIRLMDFLTLKPFSDYRFIKDISFMDFEL